jgi:hypothetical protein
MLLDLVLYCYTASIFAVKEIEIQKLTVSLRCRNVLSRVQIDIHNKGENVMSFAEQE